MTRKEFEAMLVTKHGSGNLAGVAMRGGGCAYVRKPTQQEYDLFRAYDYEKDPEATQMAFTVYVQGCFVGALDKNDEELTLQQVIDTQGPAFASSGALGNAVNKLAGSYEAQTRFL